MILAGAFTKQLKQTKSLVQPALMAQKTLRINKTNGDERMVSVLDTTTVKEILQQCHEDSVQDRQATLLRGVTVLEPDMTVSKAGLEDGADISLVWSDPFIEMASCKGEEVNEILYARIPPGITHIDDRAFNNCAALLKVVIPDSVTSIGDHAFAGCSSLTQVTIPNSVTSIANAAFHCCRSLTHVTMSNSVTSIGESAFANCSSLRHVNIPNSVTSIGNWAFIGCSSLREIEIPDSVTNMGEKMFLGCISLVSDVSARKRPQVAE